MIAWVQILPALLTAAAFAILPGLPAALILRLRGLTLVAGSIAASFAVIGLSSFVTPYLGMTWGVLPVLAVSVVLAVVAGIVRLFDRSSTPSHEGPSRARRIAYCAAFVIAAVLIVSVIVPGIGRPWHFSQSYDNVFHLNAVAWILETGNASPTAMTMTSPELTTSFYPTLWHAVVALVVQVSGATIPFATNALSIVVAAGVWPLAIMFFARPFFRSSLPAIVASGIIAAAFSAFPYHVFSWGILYPNLLSVALLPIALGFLHAALRHHRLRETGRIGALWIGFAGALGASVLAHPNAVLGLIAISLPVFVVVAVENFTRFGSSPKFWGRLAGIGVAVLCMAFVWRSISTDDSNRDFGNHPVTALLGALTNSPITSAHAWFITVFVLLGAVLLWRGATHRWLVISYGITVMLYVVVSSTVGPFRDFFTSGWYNDAHRLAFLLPITAVPLAVAGAAAMLRTLQQGLGQASFAKRVLVVGIALLLVVTGTRGASMDSSQDDMFVMFEPGAPGLVSDNELALMERLDETTPADALIAGNPWNGSGLAFALGHRDVLFPHLKGVWSPEAQQFAQDLRELPKDEVCALVEELGVTHVLGSDEPLYIKGSESFEGLNDLQERAPLTKIDSEGDATLYRIDGCN